MLSGYTNGAVTPHTHLYPEVAQGCVPRALSLSAYAVVLPRSDERFRVWLTGSPRRGLSTDGVRHQRRQSMPARMPASQKRV